MNKEKNKNIVSRVSGVARLGYMAAGVTASRSAVGGSGAVNS